ncbi:MAG: substrate-binding periplasmic protein [Pseudolabrys sp.]
MITAHLERRMIDMRLLRWFAAITVLAGSAVAPAASAEPLRVAHDQRFPPFAQAENGQSSGLAVDLLRAAAKHAGLDIAFVPVPFQEIQTTLTDGRADAIFPIAITPERKQSFDFSTPLLPTGGALFVRAPEKTPASLAAIAGKTVTTPRTGPLAAYLQKTAPDAKLIVTANYDESLAQLVSGQADVAALNFQTGAQLAARLHPGKITPPDRLFWELPFAIAVPKGKSADTLRKLDSGIAAIRADGTFDRINAEFLKR